MVWERSAETAPVHVARAGLQRPAGLSQSLLDGTS